MAIKIEKQFELDAPIDRVWAFMTDPYQVVSCLPGASITERLDERTYGGTITVKVGPVTVNYKGKAQFERMDPVAHEAELAGRAQDVKGKGSADGRLVTRLQGLDKNRTLVTVVSEVALIGPLAQFGGRLLQDVADEIIKQSTTLMQQKLSAYEKPSVAPPRKAEATPIHGMSFALKVFWRMVIRLFRRVFGMAETS
jgi:carbon monoxide dehydrogenase subunit G